jgi:adenylosuccinate lyase
VSCSVVRRVLLPDAFFAVDGVLETSLVVLTQMEVYEEVIQRENTHYGPFLATTTILMEAVKAGAGREEAHEAIKEHAVATVRDLRTGKIAINDLVVRLAADERLPLDADAIGGIVERVGQLVGVAGAQVDTFAAEVASWVERFPGSSRYSAGDIL